MIRLKYVVGLLSVLVLVLAACGDDTPDASPDPDPDPPADEPTEPDAEPEEPGDEPEPEEPEGVSFEGERITWVVTWEAGGTGDPYARIAAEHLPRHIPGEPTIIVENMTGGGHNIGANYMYDQAPSDGTTWGSFPSHRYIASAIGEEGANFDATEFHFLATLWGGGSSCHAWHESGIESVEDLTGDETWIVGSLAPSAAGATAVNILAPDLDWNVDLILGYDGNTEVALAMEQGEVNGMCLPWANLLSFGPEWEDQVTPLFVIGIDRDPGLPDTPATSEQDVFPLSDLAREAMDAYVSRFAVNISVMLHPDTPDDVVQTLRDAFSALMEDPEYLAAMEQAGLPVDGAMEGVRTQEIIQMMHDTSPEAWDYVLQAQGE